MEAMTEQRCGVPIGALPRGYGDPSVLPCGLPIRQQEGGACAACGHVDDDSLGSHIEDQERDLDGRPIGFPYDVCTECVMSDLSNPNHRWEPRWEHVDEEGPCARVMGEGSTHWYCGKGKNDREHRSVFATAHVHVPPVVEVGHPATPQEVTT